MILAVSIIGKISFALLTSSFGSSELFTVHGTISEVHISGTGGHTYIELEPGGKMNQYASFFGRVWPGMTNLNKGDVIDITAWEQGEIGEVRDHYPHLCIWQLTKGHDVIIRGEDIRRLKKDSDNSLNRFANWLLIFSSILTVIAYIRHLGIRSDTTAESNKSERN